MDEQRLAEIEAQAVAETSGPPWFVAKNGGSRFACPVLELIAEVRRLREEVREAEQEADALWEEHSRG